MDSLKNIVQDKLEDKLEKEILISNPEVGAVVYGIWAARTALIGLLLIAITLLIIYGMLDIVHGTSGTAKIIGALCCAIILFIIMKLLYARDIHENGWFKSFIHVFTRFSLVEDAKNLSGLIPDSIINTSKNLPNSVINASKNLPDWSKT